MPLLRDVRSLLNFSRKRRPIEIDLTGTQAEALTAEIHAADSANGNGNGVSLNGKHDDHHAISRRHAGNGSRASNTEELMSLVRKMGEHMDNQADRTDRVIEVMDRLPKSLEVLPEINRQNACLIEALHDHLTQARERDSALHEALTTLTKSAGRQAEVLGLIQQQLDANHEAGRERAVAMARLNDSMNVLATSNTRTGDMFAEMAQASEARQGELTAMLGRTQKWVIGTMICCAAASMTALAVAMIAMLK